MLINTHTCIVRQEAAAAGRFDRQVPFGAMHSSGARWHAEPSSGGLIEEKPARGQIGSIGIWEMRAGICVVRQIDPLSCLFLLCCVCIAEAEGHFVRTSEKIRKNT